MGKGGVLGTPIIWAKPPDPYYWSTKPRFGPRHCFHDAPYDFYTIPECDGQTDGQTEFYVYSKLSEVSEKGRHEITYRL